MGHSLIILLKTLCAPSMNIKQMERLGEYAYFKLCVLLERPNFVPNLRRFLAETLIDQQSPTLFKTDGWPT